VKQDMVEARSNVTKRLDFIKSEVERLEKQVKDIEGKVQAKQQEVGRRGCCCACSLSCRVACAAAAPWSVDPADHGCAWLPRRSVGCSGWRGRRQ
jgi:hypothetical protein